MSSYNFYYDEFEHSHKIRSSTIEDKDYYDNFLATIVGWQTDKENDMYKKHNAFEELHTEFIEFDELIMHGHMSMFHNTLAKIQAGEFVNTMKQVRHKQIKSEDGKAKIDRK